VISIQLSIGPPVLPPGALASPHTPQARPAAARCDVVFLVLNAVVAAAVVVAEADVFSNVVVNYIVSL